jgi:hypothetical protein
VPPPRTSVAPAVTPSRVVAVAFDALVRSSSLVAPSSVDEAVRAGRELLVATAERLLEAWRSVPELVLELTPQALVARVRGEVEAELDGRKAQSKWLLFAFMAGVRGICLSSETTSDQALELGARLSALRSTEEAIDAFQSWLWAEGSPGFVLDVMPSFVEQMEATTQQSSGTVARFRHAVEAPAVMMDARDAQRAIDSPAFDVPLERFAARLQRRELEVSGAEFSALRRTVDDPGTWFARELTAWLEAPRLRALLPAARQASRLAQRVRRGAGVEVLLEVARLTEEPTSEAKELSRELDQLDLVTDLLARAPMTEVAFRTFARVIQGSGPSGSRVARTLVIASLENSAIHARMVALLEVVGVTRLYERLGGASDERALTAFLSLITTSQTEPHEIAEVLASAPSDTVTRFFAERSSTAEGLALTRRLHAVVRDKVLSASSDAFGALVLALASEAYPEGVEILVPWLERGAIAGWTGRQRLAAFGALLRAPETRARLVAWVRDRRLPEATRFAALEVISEEKELLREATRFRLSELLEQGTFARALSLARKKLKGKV